MTQSDRKLVIVYDGKCPFCNSYVQLMALREAIGNVELIDARSADPVVLGLESAGYILDGGMAALYGGEIYYGADAVVLISTMTHGVGWTAKVLAWLLASPARAEVLFPVIEFAVTITPCV